jgi:hypothetical protein
MRSDCSFGNFLLLTATLTVSFSRRLSTSLVIHFAPATPTRKAPAKAENLKLITERRLLSARAAILETDKAVLQQRVSVAEAAIIAREREIFYAGGNAEEKEELEDALYALHAFKTAWQHSDAA